MRTFGVEEIGVLIPWFPDVTDGKATVADKKKLLELIDKRHKDGNPLTLRQERDVKKQAVKLLKLKMPVVRKLITEWKAKEVITTVRVNKGEKKLQGVGLTENGRKLLENYGREWTPNRPKRTPTEIMDASGRQTAKMDANRGVFGRQTGANGRQIVEMDAKGGRHFPPIPPLANASLGRGSAFAQKFNSELRKIIDA